MRRTWMTRTRTQPWRRMRLRLRMAATVLTVVCLLATGCTSATGTTAATPPGTGVGTAELADASWRGTFQVDGQLSNAPAHVGSAGCAAIGRMALDLHHGAIGTPGGVGGRLRVWAVAASGTTGTACGRRDRSQGSLLGTLSSDGTRLQAGGFRLLGVRYGWLIASITTFPVTPTMQLQQMQAQFGAGHGHHHSLRGTFTLATTVAKADIRPLASLLADQPSHRHLHKVMVGCDGAPAGGLPLYGCATTRRGRAGAAPPSPAGRPPRLRPPPGRR